MNKPTAKRRSQAERRAESRQAVLDSACRLFGEKGYNDTSLEEIATDCQLTIRPIYHYFGNKKSLFEAVNETMEDRIIETLSHSEPTDKQTSYWASYLELCKDPAFRRIVLIDAPTVLGRDRWKDSRVTRQAQKLFSKALSSNPSSRQQQEIHSRIVMAAIAEAALAIAESADPDKASLQVTAVITKLFST